jgi:hypothetical protein
METMKNSSALTVVVLMFISSICLPFAAAVSRKGSTVEVTMIDGYVVTGELLAVKADALLVFDRSADQGMSLDLRQVDRVKVIKKSKSWKGVFSGFTIGTVLVLGIRLKFPNSGKDEELSNLGFPFLAGMLGGLVGGLTSMPEKFSLAKESFKSMHQNLERLKRYARERDPDLPGELR